MSSYYADISALFTDGCALFTDKHVSLYRQMRPLFSFMFLIISISKTFCKPLFMRLSAVFLLILANSETAATNSRFASVYSKMALFTIPYTFRLQNCAIYHSRCATIVFQPSELPNCVILHFICTTCYSLIFPLQNCGYLLPNLRFLVCNSGFIPLFCVIFFFFCDKKGAHPLCLCGFVHLLIKLK